MIVRIHVNIKPILDFAARPINRPFVPKVWELVHLWSEMLQILKKQR